MQGGTPTTVGKLADELQVTTEQVLEACRRAGVSTFGVQTPLDGNEASRVRAAIGAEAGAPWSPPAPGAPPPAGAPLPPPPGALWQAVGAERPRPRAVPPWAVALLAVVTLVVVLGAAVTLTGSDEDEDGGVEAAASDDDSGTTVTAAPDEPEVGPGPDRWIGDLVVGDCWSDPHVENQQVAVSDEIGDVVVVPCDQPHQAEVFHVDAFVDPAGTPFLGEERLAADAEQRCVAAWEPFVGRPIDQSVFNVTFSYPTERSWLQGDRGIVCSLYPLDGTLLSTGARGVGR
jgi:hypothetical protein